MLTVLCLVWLVTAPVMVPTRARRRRALAGTVAGSAKCGACRHGRIRHIGGRDGCTQVDYEQVLVSPVTGAQTGPGMCTCEMFVPDEGGK